MDHQDDHLNAHGAPDRYRQDNTTTPRLRFRPASNPETTPTSTIRNAPPSSASSILSPSTQTSYDLQNPPDSSLSVSTVTPADTSPAFVWGNQPSHLTSPALEDEPLSRDDSFALPDASMLQVPPASTLNYDDELSQLNSPQALFERCITCLRRQFEGQRDQLSYATNLWQYVMAREPFLLPPLFPPSNNRQSVSSPPRSTGGHRPPVYACVLCSGRPQFTSRGSLKRHVNRHRAKSEFRCPVPGCRWKRNRKDKVRDHLRRHGYPHGWSRAAIAQLEFPLPAPTECEICLKNPPFRSWDEWFECIESHCRLETPLPDHTPGLPDGQDGNGNGGTGGAGFGNGSSFPGPAGGGFLNPGASGDGMHFVSNGGGYSQPWLGPGYNVYMSDNFCPPDPSSASHHQVSTRPIALSAESRRSRSSGDSSDGSSSIHDGLNKKGPAELQPAEDGQDRTSQKCRRCGHVSTSCPECPPDPGPVEWCHTCKDNMPSPIASRLLNFIGSCDRYQDLACNGVSNRRNMRYAIGETVDRNLSRVYVVGYRPRRRSKLVSLKWKPKSIDSYPSPSTKTQKADRTATISKTPFPTSSELNQTALIYSLLQWEIVFRIVIGWTSFCFLDRVRCRVYTVAVSTPFKSSRQGLAAVHLRYPNLGSVAGGFPSFYRSRRPLQRRGVGNDASPRLQRNTVPISRIRSMFPRAGTFTAGSYQFGSLFEKAGVVRDLFNDIKSLPKWIAM